MLSLAAAAPAVADSTLYHRGAWGVRYVDPTTDSMAYCDATGQVSSGRQSVSVIAYDDGSIVLMFFDAAWDLTPGQMVDAIANVDYVEWPVTGETKSASIHVPLSDGATAESTANAFLDALAGGTAIALKTVDGTRLATISLRGSAGAITALADCVRHLPGTGSEIVSNPFGTPSGTVPATVSAEVAWGVYPDDPGRVWVSLSGEVTERTFDDFQRVAAAAARSHTSPLPIDVWLESPGGELSSGIAIGEAIRARQWSTAVEGTCASVCAIMWLGGAQLWAAPAAHIGLHQAYYDNGEVTVSGNAVVGSYLGRMGYSYALVRLATSAAPGEMRWLTDADTRELGLSVSLLR